MPPSKRSAVTPREAALQAGCGRVKPSGLFRSNFPIFTPAPHEPILFLRMLVAKKKQPELWEALAVRSEGDCAWDVS